MKDIIKLDSRDYTKNSLVKVEERSYKLETSSCYVRGGFLSDGRTFIDPSGGPMLVEGEYLPEADAYIESINNGIITFKES